MNIIARIRELEYNLSLTGKKLHGVVLGMDEQHEVLEIANDVVKNYFIPNKDPEILGFKLFISNERSYLGAVI